MQAIEGRTASTTWFAACAFRIAPSNGILHKLACALASPLLAAASATGATVGAGAGGSGGVGVILGIALGAGVQVVADPGGNVGVALNFSATFPGPVVGLGVIGGGQVSVSNAKNIFALGGDAVDAGASGGTGPAIGLDVSRAPGGTYTGTATVGGGVGGKGAALTASHTWVPSSLSTNCGG